MLVTNHIMVQSLPHSLVGRKRGEMTPVRSFLKPKMTQSRKKEKKNAFDAGSPLSCPNPVHEGRDPAGFSVLPARQKTGRTENPAGLALDALYCVHTRHIIGPIMIKSYECS